MPSTIITKNGSGAPLDTDLVAGELAVDLTNGRLYTTDLDSGGTVLELGSNPYNFTANHDGSAKLATTATGIQVTGDIANASGDLTLDVAGDIILDAGGSEIRFSKAGTEFGKFATDIGTPSQFAILSSVIDGDIRLQGNDGGSTITALTLDMSEAGAATFNAGATFGLGIDVTGTVTADGLTVDDVVSIDTSSGNAFSSTGNLKIDIDSDDNQTDRTFQITSDGSSKTLFEAKEGGNISFYDSAGTSQSFFWDASAESLGIGTSSPSAPLDIVSSATGGTTIELDNTSAGGRNFTLYSSGSGNSFGAGNFALYDADAAAVRLLVDSNGNVGIGTSSPSTVLGATSLEVSNATGSEVIVFRDDGSTEADDFCGGFAIGNRDASGTPNHYAGMWANTDTFGQMTLKFAGGRSKYEAGTPDMVIDIDGNVGIGGTNPLEKLFVAGNVFAFGAGSGDGTYGANIQIGKNNGPKISSTQESSDDDVQGLAFFTKSSSVSGDASVERMRIDSSGNLLVGTTTLNGTGITLGAGNYGYFSRSGDAALFVNRSTSDGDLIELRKADVKVGSIGTTTNSYNYFSGPNTGIFCYNAGVGPTSGDGVLSDNAKDLGAATNRWDDIYATNGTIQTSDRNEKQDIEALSDAEQRVAVAAKGLLRKFRWKSSVAENGDEARTHFGIIAQDLQAAFEAEGLDAGNYAMFIHSTWTDEETGEERSRMGVRYSELLAFIIAAI